MTKRSLSKKEGKKKSKIKQDERIVTDETSDLADNYFVKNFDFINSEFKIDPENLNGKEYEEDWLYDEYEGQLSVDVFQSKDNIIVKSTIAGVKPENLDIYVDNDMLTIRGKRMHEEEVLEKDYFYKECFWGGFSRSIILPVEVKVDEIQATLKNGILTILLPKLHKNKKIEVEVIDEE